MLQITTSRTTISVTRENKKEQIQCSTTADLCHATNQFTIINKSLGCQTIKNICCILQSQLIKLFHRVNCD